MGLVCTVKETLDSGGHEYRVLIPADDKDEWLTELAEEYVRLRTACARPLSDISLEGIGVVSTENLLQRLKKAPKFVTGFTGPEIYIAMTRGEIDAHATGAARFVIEQSEWIEKKQINLHATLTVPKGRHHPTFARLPDFDSFAKNDVDRKLLDMFRAFQYPRALHLSSRHTERPGADDPRSDEQVLRRPGISRRVQKVNGRRPRADERRRT